MKPGADVATIHTPVPGFNPKIFNQVSNYFKALKSENAFWRANWFVTPLEDLSPFEREIMNGIGGEEVRTREDYLDQEVLSHHPIVDIGTRSPSEMAVRTEYQTIFKLAKSGCIVFGIHTYIDPLEALQMSPKAAAMIGRSTSVMDEEVLKYRGINNASRDNIIKFCSELENKI